MKNHHKIAFWGVKIQQDVIKWVYHLEKNSGKMLLLRTEEKTYGEEDS